MVMTRGWLSAWKKPLLKNISTKPMLNSPTLANAIRWIAPPLPSEPGPTLKLSEMLTDFELSVQGIEHAITLKRSPFNDGKWRLVYSFMGWDSKERHFFVMLHKHDEDVVRFQHEHLINLLKGAAT